MFRAVTQTHSVIIIILIIIVVVIFIIVGGVKRRGADRLWLSPEADFAVFVPGCDAVVFRVTGHTGEGVPGTFLIRGLQRKPALKINEER